MNLGERLWNDIMQNENLIKDSLNLLKRQHGIVTEAQLKVVKENLRDMITYVQVLMSNRLLDNYRNKQGETLLKSLLEDAQSALKFLRKVNYSYYNSELLRLVERLVDKLQEYLEEIRSDESYKAKREYPKKYEKYDEKLAKVAKEHLILCELCDEIRRKDKIKTGKVISELHEKITLENTANTLITQHKLAKERINLLYDLLKKEVKL